MSSQEYAARVALLERLTCGPSIEERLLDALALPKDADVLDVGAGNGALLSALRSLGHTGRLVGSDVHPAQVPGVEWIVGSAEALPFPDASFDAACFLRSLPHLASSEQALREAWRAVRKGGQVIAAGGSSHHLARFWRIVGEATAFLPAWRRALAPNGPSPEERLSAPFRALGLETRLQLVTAPLAFTPPDALGLLGTYHPIFNLEGAQWSAGESAARAAFMSLGHFGDVAELALLTATKE